MQIRPLFAAASLTSLLFCAACATDPEPQPAGTAAQAPPAPVGADPTPPPPGPGVLTPVVGRVLSAPVPVPATDGKVHLAYELVLTNTLPEDVTLTGVEVRSGDRTLLSLPGERLTYWTRLAGNPTPTTVLGPAQTGYVWLDVAVDPDEAVPTERIHSVAISVAEPSPPLIPATLTENIAPVTVQTREPVAIAPPLTGPNWLDGDSCCDMSAHRTALNPINGEIWAAERFAIDYVQLGPDGRMLTGDETDLASYPYYGSDVVAVGDGPVVGVVDGLPEQVPGQSPTGLPLEEYGGNHVVQDLGGGNYAFYAHLKTDSVQVETGDQLNTGQVLGALGNSGNSDAPHLHFHVMSTPDPLRSDGLPFTFTAFQLDSRLTGDLDSLLNGQTAELEPGFAPRDETNVSPLVYDVMTYADR